MFLVSRTSVGLINLADSLLSGTLLGIGSGQVNLSCQQTVWTNPNWTIGSLYSTYETTCKPTELQITAAITPDE